MRIARAYSPIMRFRRKILRSIMERLNQFGLAACPVCEAEHGLQAARHPVVLNSGALYLDEGHPAHDPEANILYMIRVSCNLCGYTMLFDVEQHHHGDEPIIFKGPPELEDEIDPDE